MTVQELVTAVPLTVVSGQEALTKNVTGGYASDLLSNVMGQAQQGNVWVTMQGHQNIIAVASLSGLAAVVVAGGSQPDQEAVKKAGSEGVVLLTSPLGAFEVVGRMHRLGIAGA